MTGVFSQALRSWRSARAIAILAAIAFAVGIGSITAIYTVVNAVMLAPLPYAHGDRYVALYGARLSEPKQFSSSTAKLRVRRWYSWRSVARPENPVDRFGRFGGVGGCGGGSRSRTR
jgi:hypothetical protein